MKKLFHISFPQVFGLHAVKRFVFENPGETESLALQGFEANKEADIDAAAKEGKRGLDKALKDGNEAIDRKAADYRKKYEGKDDKDAAEKAINAARDAAKVKLEAKHKAALEALRQNSVTAGNEAANALVQDRKEKAKGKYPDNQLEKYSVGNSSLDWKEEGKDYDNEDMSDGAFKEIMVGMLRAVYVAEGEEAANALLERMKQGNKVMDFEKMKYDKDFNLAQGVEHNPPLIQFDPDVTSGDYNSRSLAGKIFGLNHAADNRIKDEKAREAYKAYIAEAGRQAGKARDAKQVDAIQTPDEWIAAHPEYKEAATEVDQEKLDKERLAKINDYLQEFPGEKGWEKDQLRGILMGRLQGENDPAKWLDLMREAGAKAYGVSVDDYKATSWADLNKSDAITKYIKGQEKDIGKYLLDKEKNHDGQGRGYVAGLLMAAEERYKDNPALLRKYREELKALTDSSEFGEKVRANLDDSAHYDRLVKDQVWGKSDEQNEKNWEERRKLGEANAALFAAVRSTLPSPDKYEETHKDKASEKAEKQPREAYVDGLLANMPAEKGKERDQLRGMLMAAIGPAENADGSKKTPAEMAKLVKPILDAMGINDSDHKIDAATQADLDKILQGRTAFGENGKKLDLSSKGYLAAMLYQAEQRYKDNPKLLEAYKKHLTDSVNTDEYKAATEAKMAKIQKHQDQLEDPIIFKKLSLEERRERVDAIAELTNQLLQETSKATKLPDNFEKDKAPALKAEVLQGNKDFLDKYGQADKLDKPNSEKSLTAIFGSVPKDKITDANKKAYEDKQKELAAELGKAKTPEDRLKILAKAQDYTAGFVDDKAEKDRFATVAEQYTLTVKIADTAKDKKKSDAYIKAMAKALGYKDDDQKVKDALAAITDAAESKRAGVLADQVVALYAGADAAKRPPIAYTKEAYDTYSAYIAEAEAKAAQAKAAAKKPAPGTGGAGGSGSGGTPGGAGGGAGPKAGPGATPGGKPPEDKDKPKETKETDPAKALAEALAAIRAVLAGYEKKEYDASLTPAAIATSIQGAITGAMPAVFGKYDLSKAKAPVSGKDASGVSVAFAPGGGDKTWSVDVTAINEKWVTDNMIPKVEQITDASEAVNKMASAVKAGVDKYAGMSYQELLDAGLGSPQKLEQRIKQEVSGAFTSLKISPTLTFETAAYNGFIFKSDAGKPTVTYTGTWANDLLRAKEKTATPEQKLQATVSAVFSNVKSKYESASGPLLTFIKGSTLAEFGGRVSADVRRGVAAGKPENLSADQTFSATGFVDNLVVYKSATDPSLTMNASWIERIYKKHHG